MDGQDPDPVVVDAEVIRKVSQENRIAVYRTLGLVAFLAVAVIVVGVLFSNTFSNTSRLDKAICVEIQFLDGIPNPNERIRDLSTKLKAVSKDCPEASITP